MMTAIHVALQAFWGGFTHGGTAIPAYEMGNVPVGASLPYITYEVAAGAMFGASLQTAFVWVKNTSGTDAQAVRAAILDLIAAAIPDNGIKLPLLGGLGLLAFYRNSAGFLQYFDDPTDPSVIGGRISVEAHYYTT